MGILGGDHGESGDYRIRFAMAEIYKTYGHRISILEKGKSLVKFGRNEAVTNATSGTTLMILPSGVNHETYINTNGIDTISSSSASDAEQVVIEGHTIDGTDLTFVVQTATLNGQNKVVLTTPLARMTHIYNNNGTNLVGAVYGYEDTAIVAGVPTDGTKVHCMIRAGKNQSEKGSTSIASTDYWLITSITVSVLEKTAAYAEADLEMRRLGAVFRPVDTIAAASGNTYNEIYDPFIIVRPNSDVRMVATASAAGVDVAGSIHGYLATIN